MELRLNKSSIILIATLVIVMIITISILETGNNNSLKEEPEKIMLLDNPSRFFSLNNAANTYFNRINDYETENLFKLINTEYIEDHNINENNIYDKLSFPHKENRVSFSTRKIYYEEVNNSKIRYYLYGYLSEELYEEVSLDYIDYYLIINLDTKTNLFDVIPYDGKIFKEELND